MYLDKYNVREKCGETLADSNSEIVKEYKKICWQGMRYVHEKGYQGSCRKVWGDGWKILWKWISWYRLRDDHLCCKCNVLLEVFVQLQEGRGVIRYHRINWKIIITSRKFQGFIHGNLIARYPCISNSLIYNAQSILVSFVKIALDISN